VHSYNYEHFSLRQRTLDHLGGVDVGEVAPDFTATRLDGTEVKLSEYRGMPVVLETGSVTCPMYVKNIEAMNALAFRYPEVAFLVLYVREAHPGERIEPHRNAEQKTDAARVVTTEEREGRTVLIDDLVGTAHYQYGAMPNTVHVIDADGVVAYRALWNDSAAVETVLQRLPGNREIASIRAPFRPAGPATLLRVLRRAGWRALWDFAKAFPSLAWVHIRPNRRAH
jgi:peroxiredoxin